MKLHQPTISFGAPAAPLGWSEPKSVGWECPLCHATYAPWMARCVNCKPTASLNERINSMGTWVMTIEGHGAHDNGLDHDANERLKQFVDQMIADGHEILNATITVGAIRQVVPSDSETPTHYAFKQ